MSFAPAAAARPRLAVLTDIGGDPDDRQSLVRLMVYANEFEIEGRCRGGQPFDVFGEKRGRELS